MADPARLPDGHAAPAHQELAVGTAVHLDEVESFTLLADQLVDDSDGRRQIVKPENVRMEPSLMISAASCTVMRLLALMRPSSSIARTTFDDAYLGLSLIHISEPTRLGMI